jgi:hypothetical protein
MEGLILLAMYPPRIRPTYKRILIGDARASTSHHRNSASLHPSPPPCFTLPISSNAKKVSASYGIPCLNLN